MANVTARWDECCGGRVHGLTLLVWMADATVSRTTYTGARVDDEASSNSRMGSGSPGSFDSTSGRPGLPPRSSPRRTEPTNQCTPTNRQNAGQDRKPEKYKTQSKAGLCIRVQLSQSIVIPTCLLDGTASCSSETGRTEPRTRSITAARPSCPAADSSSPRTGSRCPSSPGPG